MKRDMSRIKGEWENKMKDIELDNQRAVVAERAKISLKEKGLREEF